MIVVADTSPLNYLVVIGEIELLPRLYKTITIPAAVAHELRQPDAPEEVRAWIGSPPPWLIMKEPAAFHDSRLADLDRGERDALALALQEKADLVLIDERDARSVAEQCGLVVAGTLRVLATAASRNLIDLRHAFTLLRATSFRASPKLFETLLAQEAVRQRGQ